MSILNVGDTVGFVATSAGLENKDIRPSLEYFEKELGLKVKLVPNLSSSYRYMAGTDSERATALMNMYQDKSVKALFAIRGCAGSTRILPLLDYAKIAQNPKPLFGLSDITAVQNAIYTRTQLINYTGFLSVTDIPSDGINPHLSASLKDILFSDTHKISSGQAHITGTTEAEIIGGCLTPFMYLAGTPYIPSFKDKILLIEDVREKTYKVDLIFNQLKQQKDFDKLKGIIFGKFSDCIIVDDFDGTINDCIDDFTSDLEIPVIKNFSYGHTNDRTILPLGKKVKMVSSDEGCYISW